MRQPKSVAVFWDFNDLPLDPKLSGCQLVENIRRVISAFGKVLVFKADLDMSSLSSSDGSELQISGVTLVDCPLNENKVDVMLVADMMAFALDHQAPATIVLITGNLGYAYAVSLLRFRQHHVVVVCPSSAPYALQSQASEHFNWDKAILGRSTSLASLEPQERDASTASSRNPASVKHEDNFVSGPREDNRNIAESTSAANKDTVTQELTHTRQHSPASSLLPPLEPTSPGPTPSLILESTIHSTNLPESSPHDSHSNSSWGSDEEDQDSTGSAESTPQRQSFSAQSSPPNLGYSVLDHSILTPPVERRASGPILLRNFKDFSHNTLGLLSDFPQLNSDSGMSNSSLRESPEPIAHPSTSSSIIPSAISRLHTPVPMPTPTTLSALQQFAVLQSHGNARSTHDSSYPTSAPHTSVSVVTPSDNRTSLSRPSSAPPSSPVFRSELTSEPVDEPSTSSPNTRLEIATSITTITSLKTDSNTSPAYFKPLVAILKARSQNHGRSRVPRGDVASELSKEKKVYKQAGVAKFASYINLAKSAGVVEVGGSGDDQWIMLRP